MRSQLAAWAQASGDEAKALAERLSSALDAAARLALLEALSEAASEITRDLAPGSVDVRLRGRDPEFVVSPPPAAEFADAAPVPAPAGPEANAASAASSEPLEEAATSRTTLRLPDHLKVRVERAAAQEGLSVNAWLVRAVADALEPKTRYATQPETRSGNSFTGWVR